MIFFYQLILDINIYHKCIIFITNINYNIKYGMLKINIMKDKYQQFNCKYYNKFKDCDKKY